MNRSLFSIGTPVLLTQLKDISRPFGRLTKANKNVILELTITNKMLTLVVPGARFEMYCETRGTAKATVGFFYFIDIIKSAKGKKIDCMITDDSIEINGLKIMAQTTFFADDSILRSIKLPLNFTDWHLLRLESQGYTAEELKFNKLNLQIVQAKKTVARNISKTHEILKLYGVKREELENLVLAKIGT